MTTHNNKNISRFEIFMAAALGAAISLGPSAVGALTAEKPAQGQGDARKRQPR